MSPSNTTIEREIVQMVFEAKQFRKGISDSIADLEDFKKSFDLNKAQSSFAELEKASRIDFAPMANALESINNKMSVMGVVAARVITKITDSIISGAQTLLGTLFFKPLTDGLGEYELQLNAVQTILANTAKAGTTLSDVTAALAELNDYADLTIYNFAQMVTNIGTFTTAGVDLQTSVSAIKGIANVAAISGAGATQAATAMYQLSQAISSGVVRLQDWMSVEKAGMGGVLFQDALIETAKVHGVAVDDMIAKNGSFRYSLSENWLTSDMLLETLEKFTGDLSDAQLKALGYTDEAIVGIQQTAQLALDAATKIKTLTALKDTLAEVLGSGWAQTWEIIFGDFEQAKQLWGRMADLFSGLIEGSTAARNDLLETWAAAGGRSKFIKAMFNMIEVGIGALRAFKNAFSEIFTGFTARNLLVLTNRFLIFSESLRGNYAALGKFKAIMKGIAAAISIVFMAISAVLSPLKALIPGLKEAGGGFFDWLANLGNTIVAFREFAIETDFFGGIVSDVITFVKELVPRLKELWETFLEVEVVQDVIRCFERLKGVDPQKLWEGFIRVVTYAAAPFYAAGQAIRFLCSWLWELKVVKDIVEWFSELTYAGVKAGIKQSFIDMADGVKELIASVKNGEIIGKFVELLGTFDGRRIKQFLSDARENFSGLGDIVGLVGEGLAKLGITAEPIIAAIKGIGKAISDGLAQVLDYFIDNAGDLDYSKFFDVINKGLIAGILLSIRNVIKGGLLGGLLGEDIGEGLTDIVEGLGDTLGTFQNNIRADTLQKIAVSIALLAGSIMLMTLIDSTKLATATGAIVVMLTALFGSAGAMRLINTKAAMKASVVIVGLSAALVIASIALRNVSGIDPDKLEDSLIAMGAGLAALVISVNTLGSKTGASMIKTIAILMGLGTALLVLSVAIRIFGEMDPDVLIQGLAGVAAALALLVASVAIISRLGSKGMVKAAVGITIMSGALILLSISVAKFGEMDVDTLQQGLINIGIVLAGFAVFSRLMDPKGMLKASIGIVIMSGALLIMGEAVKSFATISWDEMLRGLVGMGAALLILVIAANVMSGAMAGALAIGVMSLALIGLATALKMFATLTWEELAIGLAAMAGTFIILGLAGYILGPVVPVLLALGIAMGLIGLGAALFGLGLFLAATGLIAIAGSAALIAVAIGTVGKAVIEILPELAEGLVLALVSFITTIAEQTPMLIAAFKTMFRALLGIFTDEEFIPEIFAGILAFITAMLEALSLALPDLLQAGADILIELLKGVAKNIGDVITAGLDIITSFMEGIADGFPKLLLQAGETILVILEGIEAAIDEHLAEIIAAGFRIAVAIVEGIVDGFKAGFLDIKAAVIQVANDALDALGIPWQFSSPSRATWEMAKLVILGFVNGLRDNIDMVDSAFAEFRETLQNQVEPLIQGIVNDLDQSPEFQPVISPVLDLDNVRRGVAELQGNRYASGVLAAVAYDQGDGLAVVPIGRVGAESTSQPVSFVQNNYSPVALDRETIYRQTRTQVARLEEERAFG